MYIKFNITGQKLNRADNCTVAANSVGFVYAMFDFTTDTQWSQLSRSAVFEHNGSSWSVMLDNDICQVPWEVLSEGEFTVSIIGVDTDDLIRATTDTVKVPVEKGPSLTSENSAEPVPSVTEQLMTLTEQAVTTAYSVREDADNGVFKGADGASFIPCATEDEIKAFIAEAKPSTLSVLWLGEDEHIFSSMTTAHLYNGFVYRFTVYDEAVIKIEKIAEFVTGSASSEEIEKIVDGYLTENPPEGSAGEDGATFIPSVDEEGNLSWTNDKGLDNPETVNIIGPQGEKGDPYTLTSADKTEIVNAVIAALPTTEGLGF